MNLQQEVEFLRVALNALRLNKMRSALTALGIIIGVASVIVMAAIGNGAQQQVQERIASLGARVVSVNPGSIRVGGRSTGGGGGAPFSEKDLRAIKEGIPEVASATGQLSGSVSVVFGAANWTTQVSGVHADYQDVKPWPLTAGRFFTADEVSQGAKVAVVGTTVVNEVFAGEEPVGQTVRINNIPFEVIGVLKSKGSTGMTDADDTVMVPLSTARSRLVGRRYSTVPDTVGSISLRISDGYELPRVMADISTLMRKQRRIKEGETDNFSVMNFAQFAEAQAETQKTIGYLLATTAAMSLVVGGIGIMNIMLVSVTERTREIGLRMAVGARPYDVLAQFLTEAIMLCIAGGLTGLALGTGITIAIAMVLKWTVAIGVGTVVMAIAVSAAVGIIFGFVPARRAARLNPIDALRYE
jgi:putative ABC transport system permease protein